VTRILWHSDPPWGGGSMGQQTATFVARLAERDYEIAVSAANSIAFGVTHWQGVPCSPATWTTSTASARCDATCASTALTL